MKWLPTFLRQSLAGCDFGRSRGGGGRAPFAGGGARQSAPRVGWLVVCWPAVLNELHRVRRSVPVAAGNTSWTRLDAGSGWGRGQVVRGGSSRRAESAGRGRRRVSRVESRSPSGKSSRGRRRVSRVELRSPSGKSSRVEVEAKPSRGQAKVQSQAMSGWAQASVNILVELKSRWRVAILAVQAALAAVLTLQAAAPTSRHRVAGGLPCAGLPHSSMAQVGRGRGAHARLERTVERAVAAGGTTR